MTEVELAILIGKFLSNEPQALCEKKQLLVLANLNIISFVNEHTIKVREDIRKDLFPHRGDSSFCDHIIKLRMNCSEAVAEIEFKAFKKGLDSIYHEGHWHSVIDSQWKNWKTNLEWNIKHVASYQHLKVDK
jgi:hypothetical protein